MLARALCCIVVTAATLALLTPEAAGVLALAAAAILSAAPGEGRRRLAAVEDAATLVFFAHMFGVAGAGGFAAMRLAVTVLPQTLTSRLRPATALVVAVLGAGPLAVLAAHLAQLGAPARWEPFAVMAPALALALPEQALARLAASAWGRERAERVRLLGLGPLLVAVVAGAGASGLAGAAVGWAAARLAIPLAMLLLAPRRRGLAWFALGVLAAGVAAATGAALPLVASPAIGLAACIFGLRVHAPAGARRLLRLTAGAPHRSAATPAMAR